MDANDIDRYMEVCKTLNEFKSRLGTCCSTSLEYGIYEFSFENYQTATMYFEQHSHDETRNIEEYLYSRVMIYYCYFYQGNEIAAMEVLSKLEKLDIMLLHKNLTMTRKKYTKIDSAFYKKMIPNSSQSKIIWSKLKGIPYDLVIVTTVEYKFKIVKEVSYIKAV